MYKRQTWDVVFECDFDDVDVYAFPYENHAVHTGYITRYWDCLLYTSGRP